ncbi:hypothetical protein PAF15_01440 [Weissella koreensis]|uniref:hypothetical protein n=1 Tax=Weissella koreensis TaxID=165096 RepID=UPI0022BA6504|nr:hypothetical protein [Weissella koreensis]MCZ9310641.1 hypothetical protein [Weissella koreensis]
MKAVTGFIQETIAKHSSIDIHLVSGQVIKVNKFLGLSEVLRVEYDSSSDSFNTIKKSYIVDPDSIVYIEIKD